MWTTEQLLAEAVGGRVGRRFVGMDEIDGMEADALKRAAEQALARPQASEFDPGARPLSRRLLAAQWTLVLDSVGLPAEPRVLELCAGGSDPVVVALDVLYGSRATYATINLNRKLAAELMDRARGLDLQVRLIEDDAQNLLTHFPRGSFDAVCFHHAVNDILQTAVAAKHGLDTRDLDWWPNERQMIEWMAVEHEAHGLSEVGLPELRAILESAATAVKPGGTLCFDHWTWHYHLGLDWFPGALFNQLIPMAREVALSLTTPLVEVTPAGLDRQWWMVLRKP
ncbi:MAG TPA: class I SAM-dependent methyltransferase [Armatimonadota bacterium]|nr:class I SAM-dependent methyltransferase [Armatimonadota bacterium]